MKISKFLVVLVFISIILGTVTGFIIYKNNSKNVTNIEKYNNKILSENITNETDKSEEKKETNKVETSNTTNTEVNDNKEDKENKVTEQKSEVKKEENKTTESNKSENNKTTETTQKKTGKIIVIDPGHQKKGDSSKEPIGPGATETKAKVTTGATGVSTKQTEAILNLKVGLLLRTELENRGYTVIMTRTTNDVNISNSQRAEIANNANADAFIRIHADSYGSSKVSGMSTLCQTSKNKYNGNLAEQSYKLSKSVLDNMAKTTGAKNRGVTRTDTMSGINWAKVPTTIVEMGFLSNPEEDKLLASEEYQNKLVKGMANGIDEFCK